MASVEERFAMSVMLAIRDQITCMPEGTATDCASMPRTLKDISNRVFRHRGSFSRDVTQLECKGSGQSMRPPVTPVCVRYEHMIHEMRYELNAAGRFLDSPVPGLLWFPISCWPAVQPRICCGKIPMKSVSMTR